jgi:hypothetical protein
MNSKINKFDIIKNKENKYSISFKQKTIDIEAIEIVVFEVDCKKRTILIEYVIENLSAFSYILSNIPFKEIYNLNKQQLILIQEKGDNSFHYPIINKDYIK